MLLFYISKRNKIVIFVWAGTFQRDSNALKLDPDMVKKGWGPQHYFNNNLNNIIYGQLEDTENTFYKSADRFEKQD